MPANDDYAPADIFSNSSQRQPSAQQQQHQDLQQSTVHAQQQPRSSPRATHQSGRTIGTNSPASTSKDSQHNPFLEVQHPSRPTDELIPTRHGAPHYFGPSSSFRLATTIRTLVARCRVIHSADFPASRRSGSALSDPASRASASFQPSSTNPSDEEYVIPNPQIPQSQHRAGKKRSRSRMEGTDDQWENTEGRSTSDTIADFLPSRSLSDALVSAYFDHIHIYLPLFHRGMFQSRLEATYSRKAESFKDCTNIGWLICLAMVFSFGCQQLQEHDPEQAHTLRLKYLSFAKTYFRKLLTTTSLENIQALVLLNVHHHTIGQKSSSWLLIGLGARMVSKCP